MSTFRNVINGTSTENAIEGESVKGRGVTGKSDSDYGMRARSNKSAGLRGSSDLGRGVEGWAKASEGVVGVSETGTGVLGQTDGAGAGVLGSSKTGIGVRGKGGLLAGQFEGDVEVTGDLFMSGANYAEEFLKGVADVSPGLCVVIDDQGAVVPCAGDYDSRVAGVVSGAGGLRPALTLDRHEPGVAASIALMGKAYVWVDADRAPVRAGDMLTTSSTGGHAMKVEEVDRAFGAVIGKALAPLASGRGLVKVFLSAR